MTKAEKAHLSRVAALGCVACYMQGTPGTPAEIHHPRAGRGKGQRASHMDGIPLCPAHHRGTHHPAVPSIHLEKRAFIERFGTEETLLELVRQLVEGSAAA
jgi:hypothetical protein